MFSSLIPGSVVDLARCSMASKSLQDDLNLAGLYPF